MFSKKNIHLVPQLLQDRVNVMLSESSALIDVTVQDNIALQIETVRDFCVDALAQYEKQKVMKRRSA